MAVRLARARGFTLATKPTKSTEFVRGADSYRSRERNRAEDVLHRLFQVDELLAHVALAGLVEVATTRKGRIRRHGFQALAARHGHTCGGAWEYARP